jgi:hypothetical protein
MIISFVLPPIPDDIVYVLGNFTKVLVLTAADISKEGQSGRILF